MKSSLLPDPKWFIPAVIAFTLIFGLCVLAFGYTDTDLVNAIFKAEGGAKAQYLYGIRSVKYKDANEARKICFNTVRNNRKRFANQTKHKLNQYWLKNVKYFLYK